MPKRSNLIQRVVFFVKRQVSEDAIVTESAMVPDLLTGKKREVDILIEYSKAGHKILIGIECRSRDPKDDVTWVEQAWGKHQRLPTNLLVLVSKSGFSQEAIEVAKKLKVELLTLERVEQGEFAGLLAGLQTVWAKTVSLSPTKVVFTVAPTGQLPSETVAMLPDNLLYDGDGNEIGTVKQLVETVLAIEPVGKEFARRGEEQHKWFEFGWPSPRDKNGRPLILRKIDPPVMRVVELIRIIGQCEFKVSAVPLEHAKLGEIYVSWGTGVIGGQESLLVATQDQNGVRRLSIEPRALKPHPVSEKGRSIVPIPKGRSSN